MFSAIGTASAEQTTTSQPHSISAPMPGSPYSTAEAAEGSVDDVSSPDGSPAPVIVGVILAVFVATVLSALVVATIICYKIKLLKKYNVRSRDSSNGELVLYMFPSPLSMYFDTVSPSVLQAQQEFLVILLMFALHVCVYLCNNITDFQVFVITSACSPTVLWPMVCTVCPPRVYMLELNQSLLLGCVYISNSLLCTLYSRLRTPSRATFPFTCNIYS